MLLGLPPTFAVSAVRPQPGVLSLVISANLFPPIVVLHFERNGWGFCVGVIQKYAPTSCDISLQSFLSNKLQGPHPNFDSPSFLKFVCKRTDIQQRSNSFAKASICDHKVSTWRALLSATPVAYCEQASKQDSPDEQEAQRGKGELEQGDPTLFRRCHKLERLSGGSPRSNPNLGRGSATHYGKCAGGCDSTDVDAQANYKLLVIVMEV